jgi:site-specific DNA recombinase
MSEQRAAGYCRVSTEEQAEHGFSLGEQERTLREDAERRGETWTRAYVDAGLSGRSKEKRPQLNEMLAAADRGEFDVLVIPALDRLARNARDAHEIFARLERAKVAIRSLRGEVDTSTATGRLMTGVMASLAEFESNVIGERTRSGKAAAARAGRPNGGPRRFGFDQANGQLIPRPEEIAVVERILREAVAGRSQMEIAVGLNADGHRTARGKPWNQTQISQLMGDPIWIGVLRNKEDDHHVYEPFVPVELWEAAQRTLRGPDGPRTGRKTQRFLLGNGLLRCGGCSSAMIVKRDRKDYGWYEVYICGGRSSGATDCTQGAVQRAAVDRAVLAYFERVGLDVEATRAELAERATRERAEIRALRGQAERELAKAEERLERVRRAFQDGIIEPDDWADQRAQLQDELTAAQQDAARLAAREAEVADGPAVLEDVELLTRLAELRSAIAGDVGANPDDFAATHAALRRVFQAFHLRAAHGHGRVDAVVAVDGEEMLLDRIPTVGGAEAAYVLEPIPRSDAVVLSGAGRVVPVPLGLRGGVNASSRPSVDPPPAWRLCSGRSRWRPGGE